MPYKDPEKHKAKCKEYHMQHRESILARQRKRRAENREHDNQVKKDWYARHPEARARDLERLSQWAETHKGRKYRRLMKENDPREVCSECGTSVDVCVHHIDGNHDNESLTNLQWLCRSCHAKLHAKLRRVENEKSKRHEVFV